MTNSGCATLIATVRARAARATDSVLITTAFVLAALNEAMVHIVRRSPGLIDLQTEDKTTFRIATWSTTETTVTAAARVSGVVTMTAEGHSLEAGDVVVVADVEGDTSFDGTFEVLSIDTNDFTYFNNLDDDTATSFGTCVQHAAKAKLDISSLDPAHIDKIWLLNGAATRPKGMKYMPKDEFFEKYIPAALQAESEPHIYTRFGDYLYFNCPFSSDYAGLQLRIDYTKWCTVFAAVDATTACDLSNSDKGLILFALAEVYDAIALGVPGVEVKAVKTRMLFDQWLAEYQNYNDLCLEELYED